MKNLIWILIVKLIPQFFFGQSPVISYSGYSSNYCGGFSITPIAITNTGGAPEVMMVSTISGIAYNPGYDNFTKSLSRFYNPNGIVLDKTGNIYIADGTYSNKIRKIGTDDNLYPVAGQNTIGSNDGQGIYATFNHPYGITIDTANNLYVTDFDNHLIRKISAAGVVSTIAGSGSAGSANGTGTAASFNGPRGIAVSQSGDIFVTDQNNHKIRKITPAGVVTTFAGSGTPGSVNGTGTAATFNTPLGIGIDTSGNLFIANFSNHNIRKITPAGVVTTLAGSGAAGSVDGTGAAATFNYPSGIAVDISGNVYVSETGSNKIRKITPAGVVTTIAGSGTGTANGIGTSASFHYPYYLALDTNGHIFISDNGSYLILNITRFSISPALPDGLKFNTVTGTITGTPTKYTATTQYIVTSANTAGSDTAVISFSTSKAPPSGSSPFSITLTSTIANLSSAVSGSAIQWYAANIGGSPLSSSTPLVSGTTYFASQTVSGCESYRTPIYTVVAPNISYTYTATNCVGAPLSFTYNNTGGPVENRMTTTIAGSGVSGSTDSTGVLAQFYQPSGVAVDASNNIFVADRAIHKIRKITPSGVVTTFVGSGATTSIDGTGAAASTYGPSCLAFDNLGNLYVGEYYGSKVRKITPSGVVTTLAGSTGGDADGTGTAAKFQYITGITVDNVGNIYVSDRLNYKIKKITPAGVVTTFVGNGMAGDVDATGTNATIGAPWGIVMDTMTNTIYFVDYNNGKLKKISSTGVVSTVAGYSIYGTNIDGYATSASFFYPTGITLDKNGNIFLVDEGSYKVRKITPQGYVIYIGGSGSISSNSDGFNGGVSQAQGIAIDTSGNLIVSDMYTHRIRKISKFFVNPSLPAGISLNTATGAITGSPSAIVGSTNYTVWAGYYNSFNTTNLAFSTNGPTLSLSQGFVAPKCYNNIDSLMATSTGTVTWSPTSTLFTNKAGTTGYTGTATTKVYSNPNSTTKFYATATLSSCTKMDSIIDSVKSPLNYIVLPSSSVSGANIQCQDTNGWTYYQHPSNTNQYIFGIKKGSATIVGESISLNVNASPYPKSNFSNGANQEHGMTLMGRDWNVTNSSMSGTADVRFFYNPSDTISAKTSRDDSLAAVKATNPASLAEASKLEWFKTINIPYDSAWKSLIVGNKFPPSHIKLTPSYGIINGVNYVEFTGITSFSGGTGGYGFGAPGISGGIALPVTWADFNVNATELGNELEWKTVSEQNTSYFQVEYSYDGTEYKVLSTKISAAGNSADLRIYNFTHPDFSSFVYYRIKQVDLDGKTDYSQIKLAKRTNVKEFQVLVYPNPIKADNILNIKVTSIDKSKLSIKISDLTGNILINTSYIPNANSVFETLDLINLQAGIYMVEVSNGQGKEIVKITR
jgi:sugar lactone lactonase YvrE